MDSGARLHAFLLLRYTLIIATAYLLLVEQDFATPSLLAGGLIALALATNVAFAQLPRRVTDSTRFAIAVIIFDTAWVTAALMSSGNFNADFFMLYFFLLLLAAVGENLRLIAVAACVVCGAYLYGHSATGGSADLWTSPSLIRIPFLFTTAIFYGHLVERTRREEQRADSAEALDAQLQRTLAEFKILYAKAQEAERIKTEFLATVSHELRTPLTTLIGYTELLIDDSYGQTTGEQRGALGKVRAAGRILQQAIGRMLDASRIDFGHERLSCDEFELQRPARRAAREPAGHAGGRGALAGRDRPADRCAPTRRSCARFCATCSRTPASTPRRGMISVGARWNRRADELEIDVSDTGVGIEPGEIDAIFEAFRQGGNRGDLAHSRRRPRPLHRPAPDQPPRRRGARQSTPGHGSTFTVLHSAAAAPRRRGGGGGAGQLWRA